MVALWKRHVNQDGSGTWKGMMDFASYHCYYTRDFAGVAPHYEVPA